VLGVPCSIVMGAVGLYPKNFSTLAKSDLAVLPASKARLKISAIATTKPNLGESNGLAGGIGLVTLAIGANACLKVKSRLKNERIAGAALPGSLKGANGIS